MVHPGRFGLLRRFLRVNKIPDGLGQRVTRFLHFTYHERSANSEDPLVPLGFSLGAGDSKRGKANHKPS
jgi:hypothetical protein